MKKNLALMVLFIITVAGLAGCGSSESNDTVRKTDTVETVAGSEGIDKPDPSDEVSENADISEAGEQNIAEADLEENGGEDILVAYFSRADENYNVGFIEKGNTAILAEMVAEITGGDLFEIKTVTPYPADYDECTDVAKQEQKDNARPELIGTIENMDQYDVCYLCYPIWWSDLPMPVYSFLDGYDWDGKTIITVNTHEGSGKAGTPDKIQKYLPNAKVIDGIAMTGSTAQNSRDEAKEQIIEWLDGLAY